MQSGNAASVFGSVGPRVRTGLVLYVIVCVCMYIVYGVINWLLLLSILFFIHVFYYISSSLLFIFVMMFFVFVLLITTLLVIL